MEYIKHFIAAAILLLLGLGLVFLPEKQNHKEVSPEQMFQELNKEERYISVDEVADRLIQNDPVLLLVDLRAAVEYDSFSLPNAVNIPIEKILDVESEEYLGRKEMDLVFYCNDGIKSEQAWQIRKRILNNNMFILKGGLDQWIQDLLLAQPPAETASRDELERYQFRKAVSLYLTGGSRPFTADEMNVMEEPPVKRTVKLRPRVIQAV